MNRLRILFCAMAVCSLFLAACQAIEVHPQGEIVTGVGVGGRR